MYRGPVTSSKGMPSTRSRPPRPRPFRSTPLAPLFKPHRSKTELFPTNRPMSRSAGDPGGGYILNLLCCQVAGGWTGLGWPHLLVGRLLLGHTIRLERGGWGSTGHYQDNACEHASRFVGSDPLPRLLGHVGEVFEGLPSDVSFQAAHDLWSG